MNESARLVALKQTHQNLSDRVVAEQKRPGACSLRLRQLKKQKLALKDEMRRLEDAS